MFDPPALLPKAEDPPTLLPNADGPEPPKLNAILALSKSGETVRTSRSIRWRLFLTSGVVRVEPKECRWETEETFPLKNFTARSSLKLLYRKYRADALSSHRP